MTHYDNDVNSGLYACTHCIKMHAKVFQKLCASEIGVNCGISIDNLQMTYI